MPVDSYNPRFLGATKVQGGTSGVKATQGGSLPNGGGTASAVGIPKINQFDGFNTPSDTGLFDANGKSMMAPANGTPAGNTATYPSSQYGGGVSSYDDNGSRPGQTRPTGRALSVVRKTDDGGGD